MSENSSTVVRFSFWIDFYPFGGPRIQELLPRHSLILLRVWFTWRTFTETFTYIAASMIHMKNFYRDIHLYCCEYDSHEELLPRHSLILLRVWFTWRTFTETFTYIAASMIHMKNFYRDIHLYCCEYDSHEELLPRHSLILLQVWFTWRTFTETFTYIAASMIHMKNFYRDIHLYCCEYDSHEELLPRHSLILLRVWFTWGWTMKRKQLCKTSQLCSACFLI